MNGERKGSFLGSHGNRSGGDEVGPVAERIRLNNAGNRLKTTQEAGNLKRSQLNRRVRRISSGWIADDIAIISQGVKIRL
ncbi:hypothetical protein H5410_029491 [Solanum commersonii]|uniref:Uncharacterized protein n=1 Tax=Solanum commersonii TaxID=4109 RepID=A0A9J5Z7W1_SOLCO|nr:hypothetical protein H5410_029491 [Solanum commersonii]